MKNKLNAMRPTTSWWNRGEMFSYRQNMVLRMT